MRYFFRALKLIRPYPGMVFLFLICTVGAGIFGGLPLVLLNLYINFLRKGSSPPTNKWSALFDSFLKDTFGSTQTSFLYGLCGSLLVLWFIKVAFEFCLAYLAGWIPTRIRISAMEQLMQHLLTLDMGFFDRSKLGDLVSRMVADTRALRAAVKVTLQFIRQPATIIFLAYLAISFDWILFLVGGLGLPLVIYPLMKITGKIYKASWKAKRQAADMAEEMLQNLSGMRIIHAYDAVENEQKNFVKMAGKLFRTVMRRNLNRAMQRPMTELFFGGGIVLVMLIGGVRVLDGGLPIEDFITFIGAMAMMQQPLRAMISALGELAEMVPSAERTFEIMDTKPKILDATDAKVCPKLSREIRFENVTLDYGRGVIFENLDLTIAAGERIGIVGRTGVGKSSLLSLLLRYYDPKEGRITLDGEDLRGVTLNSLRSQMAFVPQDPYLFHTTIEENIRYGKPDASLEEIEAAARSAAVHDEIAELPDGYKTVVGERGVTLSGGQRQRVSIARAILRDAAILLLDEATSALDSNSEKLVQDALDNMTSGRTSLIVAHRLSTLRNANRIVVFGDTGGIETVGDHNTLMATSPTYKRLWESQGSAERRSGEEDRREPEDRRKTGGDRRQDEVD